MRWKLMIVIAVILAISCRSYPLDTVYVVSARCLPEQFLGDWQGHCHIIFQNNSKEVVYATVVVATTHEVHADIYTGSTIPIGPSEKGHLGWNYKFTSDATPRLVIFNAEITYSTNIED